MLPRIGGAADRLKISTMQTLSNHVDATLKRWPASLEEWETKPEITFTVARDRIIHPGDRILATTKLITTGANSGSVKNIYYYIEEITSIEKNKVHITDTDITAKAKREER